MIDFIFLHFILLYIVYKLWYGIRPKHFLAILILFHINLIVFFFVVVVKLRCYFGYVFWFYFDVNQLDLMTWKAIVVSFMSLIYIYNKHILSFWGINEAFIHRESTSFFFSSIDRFFYFVQKKNTPQMCSVGIETKLIYYFFIRFYF